MNQKDKFLAQRIYFILSGLFICSLVVSNLIFQKFFYWYPFGNSEFLGAKFFEISVGILPYPITFLITDLISEIYGKKKANQVVTSGIFASIFSLGIVYVANHVPAIEGSPVDDVLFTKVFGQTALAVLASMLAYLAAQYIDIQVYHFWKKVTQGKMLWVRNNFSTITSQAVDTFTVLLLLCFFEILPWNVFGKLFISGFAFKLFIALLDTPFLYLFVFIFRKRFNLKLNDEISID
ncbi:MAG: queuosine precursor transporter [Flavobacterium haoranii]